jgi:hypothetical protein
MHAVVPFVKGLGSSFLVALLTLACASPQLRTVPHQPNVTLLCGDAGIPAFRLVIDLTSTDPVWGVAKADGKRFSIIWPQGFSLRVGTEPAVLDPTGKVVAKNGAIVTDAGGENSDPATICQIGGEDYPLQLTETD